MWLINTKTLKLHDLVDIPRYAILSHTWGEEEVTFRDMASPTRLFKKGYAKIVQTCRLARERGIDYAWVDTCCIDKSSSAELNESINSMFRWYQEAEVCYVFLADLLPPVKNMGECRWFTRGWTLQELLAPRKLEFYDGAWCHIGSKIDFIALISRTTRIPREVLLHRLPIRDCSVAARMAWAASRKTTRVEDEAYCLLGIFDVHMPLIYGEGHQAFRRLQEEIVKRNSDLTIFAWDAPPLLVVDNQLLGLFAPAPAAFTRCSGIVPFRDDFAEFAVTNKGLLLSGGIPLRALVKPEQQRHCEIYGLFLGHDAHAGGVFLRKIAPGLFCRDGCFELAGIRQGVKANRLLKNTPDFHILTDVSASTHVLYSVFRKDALRVPVQEGFLLSDAAPESLWDIGDRLFLRPKPYTWYRNPMALALSFKTIVADKKVRLVVLCDYRGDRPICRVFTAEQHPREAKVLFEPANRELSIPVADLEKQNSDLILLKDNVNMQVGDQWWNIAASLQYETVKGLSSEFEVYNLVLGLSQVE
ncbi:heterokaryon incompatibility protein-domain-containing protein [Staphylotrichum tortipilum]|uniref:Heterokaryon incompatibility protein-domain-containing protein n=1 Tax=Staphylotrichum tortipilum TaxID=2831512 RepID=A0AAN6MG97_9PEZI|nr:heterokaryon incompatibility protein-domain-containing protein [Staphylotrichum longicolle]